MTTNPTHSGDSLLAFVFRMIRLALFAWLAWILLVSVVALWMYVPMVAILLTTVAVTLVIGLIIRRVQWYTIERAAYQQRFEALVAQKEAEALQKRLHRAQQYPDLVFEENAAQWAKEMS